MGVAGAVEYIDIKPLYKYIYMLYAKGLLRSISLRIVWYSTIARKERKKKGNRGVFILRFSGS